jgi:hypothetical protein
MAHDRDHDHPPAPQPRVPQPLSSRLRPDYKRREHPTALPREPVDPKSHPSRERTRASSSGGSRDPAGGSAGDTLEPRRGV